MDFARLRRAGEWLLAGSLSFLSVPAIASAHVKWFLDGGVAVTAQPYILTSVPVLAWAGIILVSVLVASFLEKIVPVPKGLAEFGRRHESQILRISQAFVGLFLVVISFSWRIVLIPEVGMSGGLISALGILQALVGIMLLLRFRIRAASGFLMLLCLGLFLLSGPEAFLENIVLFCLAGYFFVRSGPPAAHPWLSEHALDLLRVGAGISLVVLAFTEKLLHPELSMQFLQIHHWNFMQPLLPWFTDQLFILSVGCAEILFGLVFILGYVTRINTVAIAVFFAFSVTAMFARFHQWEVEDLVIYAAALLFVFHGRGKGDLWHLLRSAFKRS